ncbi:hypothetical protein GEMRC1_003249 [Eukaryota sp. GEM-RC1]
MEGLRLFKTNFTLFGTLLPNKSRKEITTKFNFELKKNPQAIKHALSYQPSQPDFARYTELVSFVKEVGWQGICTSQPKDVEQELEEEKYFKPDVPVVNPSEEGEEDVGEVEVPPVDDQDSGEESVEEEYE